MTVDGKCYYVASLDEGRKRIRDRGLLARGNGTWTLDEERFEFTRALLGDRIRIRRDQIESSQLSRTSWWGGKWLLRARVVEVTWTREDGTTITSGFVFSGERDENEAVAAALAGGA